MDCCVVMFRIVEDDTPPIPTGCSALLQDFLRQCFQKDPAMRPSAQILSHHEWLKANSLGEQVRVPNNAVLSHTEIYKVPLSVNPPAAVGEEPSQPPRIAKRFGGTSVAAGHEGVPSDEIPSLSTTVNKNTQQTHQHDHEREPWKIRRQNKCTIQ
jgi:serine/threonine protein kinase